jgi:hypothetical protein
MENSTMATETPMERKSQISTREPPRRWLSGLLRILHSLGIWNEKQAMAFAVARDHPYGYRVTTEAVVAVTVDELAAPVPTEALMARSRDLQARIEAARTLLKAREV